MGRIAVTGGAGFLGSHIVKHLISRGDEVLIIDDLSSGLRSNLIDLSVEQDCIVGDLRDYDFAKQSLTNIDTVYHFAAEVGSVDYLHGSYDRELAALQANLVIDANVFKACRENRVGCIIYASSVSVYPFEQQLGAGAVFKEDDAMFHVNPEGGYGWSKFLGEVQLNMMQDTSVGIARIFHAYGENIYIRPNRSQVIATLIRKAIRYPAEGFTVWGDGSQRRCFVFIDDVLDALDKLEKYVRSNGKLTVNLGSQDEVTIKQLAMQIAKLSDKDVQVEFDPTKPTGALSRTPDLKQIRSKLGWVPRVPLGDGLIRTYRWAERRLATSRT